MKIIEAFIAAATTPPTTAGSDPAPGWFQALQSNQIFLMIGLVLLVSMFLGKGGKRGEEKARVEMLKQLKRGDRIQTIGGIQGTVARAEETRVEVKVDESNNTKMWFARTAIARVLEAEKVDKSEVK